MDSKYYDGIAHTFPSFSVTYNNRLFNHLPMTITSLESFGASSKRLESYRSSYCSRLTPIEVVTDIDDNVKEFSELEKNNIFYLDKINELGIDKTLKSVLPTLINGIGAGNFYALNRLTFGVKQKNVNEIAMGLALWKTLYLDLGKVDGVNPKRPTSLLRHVSKIIGHIRFSAGNTTDRMKSVATLIDYQQTPHQPELIDFLTIAKATGTIYKMSGDFVMLHSVTACWSFYQLIPFMDDEEKALRSLWQAIVVAYLSAGSPSMNIVDKIPLVPWEDIVIFCCESNNEHLIELCYACQHLHTTLQDDVFHLVASKYVAIYAEPVSESG